MASAATSAGPRLERAEIPFGDGGLGRVHGLNDEFGEVCFLMAESGAVVRKRANSAIIVSVGEVSGPDAQIGMISHRRADAYYTGLAS